MTTPYCFRDYLLLVNFMLTHQVSDFSDNQSQIPSKQSWFSDETDLCNGFLWFFFFCGGHKAIDNNSLTKTNTMKLYEAYRDQSRSCLLYIKFRKLLWLY